MKSLLTILNEIKLTNKRIIAQIPQKFKEQSYSIYNVKIDNLDYDGWIPKDTVGFPGRKEIGDMFAIRSRKYDYGENGTDPKLGDIDNLDESLKKMNIPELKRWDDNFLVPFKYVKFLD